MAIEHHPRHVSSGRDDLTSGRAKGSLVVTVIKRWILIINQHTCN